MFKHIVVAKPLCGFVGMFDHHDFGRFGLKS
jgi:hypothetical protein